MDAKMNYALKPITVRPVTVDDSCWLTLTQGESDFDIFCRDAGFYRELAAAANKLANLIDPPATLDDMLAQVTPANIHPETDIGQALDSMTPMPDVNASLTAIGEPDEPDENAVPDDPNESPF